MMCLDPVPHECRPFLPCEGKCSSRRLSSSARQRGDLKQTRTHERFSKSSYGEKKIVSLYSVTGLATWYMEGGYLRSFSGWGFAFHAFLPSDYVINY